MRLLAAVVLATACALPEDEVSVRIDELADPGSRFIVGRDDFGPGKFAHWGDLLSASRGHQTIEFLPGNYEDVPAQPNVQARAPGATYLSLGPDDSGTADEPRTFRASGDLHPFFRAPEEEVRLSGFHVGTIFGTAAHNVILQGFTFRGGAHQNAIWFGSSDNTVDSILVEENTSPYGVRILLWAQRNKVQNSVFRNPAFRGDGVAMQIRVPSASQGSGTMYDNQFLGNLIVDYNDGIAVTQSVGDNSDSVNGTIFADNYIFITPEKRSASPSGYVAAENAIDIKGGSSDPNNPVRVVNNRMHGFRYFDSESQVSGSDGAAIVIHNWARHVHVYGNTIWDSPVGTRIDAWPAGFPQIDREVVFEANVFHSIQSYAPEDRGVAFVSALPATFYRNTFSGCDVMMDRALRFGAHIMRENVAVNCPLGLAQASWLADGSNRTVKAIEMETLTLDPNRFIGGEPTELSLAQLRTTEGPRAGFTRPQKPDHSSLVRTDRSGSMGSTVRRR